MNFTSKHKTALRRLQRNGAAVTFVQETQGTHDPLTETFTPGDRVEVKGYGIEVSREAAQYTDQDLLAMNAVLLTFVPLEMGDIPAHSSSTVWAGKRRTVQGILNVRPAGTPYMATLVLV